MPCEQLHEVSQGPLGFLSNAEFPVDAAAARQTAGVGPMLGHPVDQLERLERFGRVGGLIDETLDLASVDFSRLGHRGDQGAVGVVEDSPQRLFHGR